MKIVKILGGLGNQMFQFAFALALKKKHPEERVLLDLRCARNYHKHHGYEISSVFHTNLPTASWSEILPLAYPYPNYNCWRIGVRLLPKRKDTIIEDLSMTLLSDITEIEQSKYYDGYWQHEEYFNGIKDEIIKAFTFPAYHNKRNLELSKTIQTCNSVSIHIRRGDYLKSNMYRDICNIDYYKQAILTIEGMVHPDLYCIFSDDMEWCKQKIVPLLNKHSVLVDWNKNGDSYNDMHLMSECKHHIIANSSFSWWGAWLNKNKDKVVITPKRWNNVKDYHSPVCKDWITR